VRAVSIRDTDGGTVELRQSSAVAAGRFNGPFIWLTIVAGPESANGEAHLTYQQARRLRDGLNRWLETA